MGFQFVDPAELEWITRPHAPDDPARHVRELREAAGFTQVRADLWRSERGVEGRRRRHPIHQPEETTAEILDDVV